MDDRRRESWRAAVALAAGAAWTAQAAQAQTPPAAAAAGGRDLGQVQLLEFLSAEQRQRLQQRSSPGDCTAALAAALKAGAATVLLPAGRLPIQPGLEVPGHVSLVGQGYGLMPGMGSTVLLKSGSGPGLVLSGAAQIRNLSIEGVPGNQGDGLLVLGGRSLVQDVSVFNQGRDGVKVGDVSASKANTNLWRLTNLICRQNGRHGLFVAHEGKGDKPDVNAGLLLGFEASLNGGDGLRVSEAVDNQFIGVACQRNAGWGVVLDAQANGNLLLAPYCEANTAGDLRLEQGADRNMVLGVRSGVLNSGVVDKGSSNVVWGRYGSVRNVPLHESPEAFEALDILDRGGSGVWRLRKLPGTRQLAIGLMASGQGADLLLQSDGAGSSGLRFANDTHSAALRDLRSRGAIEVRERLQPGESRDLPLGLSGVDARCLLVATPQFAPPPGVVWSPYVDPASKGAVLRISNLGGQPVELRGPVQVAALRIG